eukprot:6317542-Prymnesium_polylepis.1
MSDSNVGRHASRELLCVQSSPTHFVPWSCSAPSQWPPRKAKREERHTDHQGQQGARLLRSSSDHENPT